MATKLTDAGFRMIGEWVELKSRVDNWKRDAHCPVGYDFRADNTLPDGRVFLSLKHGCGASAATVRKLVRDGMAEGQYSWTRGRVMVPTEDGLAAYWAMRERRAA